jgi:hypothetical protein
MKHKMRFETEPKTKGKITRHWLTLLLVLCLVPALTSCVSASGTAGEQNNGLSAVPHNNTSEDSNTATTALQNNIPSPEHVFSEGIINMGNDRIPSIVKTAGERELLQMDTFSSYPIGSVEVTLKYATKTTDLTQANKDAQEYIQFLTDSEGFTLTNPSGEIIPGGYTLYKLGKNSIDPGKVISVSIYIGAESHLIMVAKNPSQ